MTGARLLIPDKVPLDIRITRIWSVGNYAIGLAFSDGHDTGIYTFKSLRMMHSTDLEDV
jgi:ATP-binding protein involved in chromosome partitioning